MTGCEHADSAIRCQMNDTACYRGEVVDFKPVDEMSAQAWAQCDYVFATEYIADRVSVRVLGGHPCTVIKFSQAAVKVATGSGASGLGRAVSACECTSRRAGASGHSLPPVTFGSVSAAGR